MRLCCSRGIDIPSGVSKDDPAGSLDTLGQTAPGLDTDAVGYIATASSPFANLLQQIAIEHHREVTQLQAELAWLRSKNEGVDPGILSGTPSGTEVIPSLAFIDGEYQAAQERTPIPFEQQCTGQTREVSSSESPLLRRLSEALADQNELLQNGNKAQHSFSEKDERLSQRSGLSAWNLDVNDPLLKWRKLISIVQSGDGHCVKLNARWHAMMEDLEDPNKAFNNTFRIQGRSAKSFLVETILTKKADKKRLSTKSMFVQKMSILLSAFLYLKTFLVIRPNSTSRMVWDMLGMLLLFHDLVTIPLQAFASGTSGFGQSYETFTNGLDIFVICFWTFDILVSFVTGYYSEEGYVELSHGKIAKNYIKSWFPLDIIIVSVDWISLTLNIKSEFGYLRIGKTFSRVMRILRLLRFMKLSEKFGKILQRINSEFILTMIGVLKLLIGMVFANHYIACGWYALSQLSLENTWSTKFLAGREEMGYAYVTSLHWSLTQFTPASMEVHPTNKYERIYTIFVIIGAMVVFSSFVSSITGAMTHLRNINAKKAEQDAEIRAYFSMNKISQELASQVWHFRRHNTMATKSRIKERDLPALKYLPERVREQLRLEVYTPMLRQHPFFSLYLDICPEGILQICNQAMIEHQFLAGQEFANQTQHVDRMLFVVYGVLEYHTEELKRLRAESEGARKADSLRSTMRQRIQQSKSRGFSSTISGAADNASLKEFRVRKGQWACEVALWSEMGRLQGSLVAGDSGCELVLLDAEKFQDIIQKHSEGIEVATKYAQVFVKCFNNAFLNPFTSILFNDSETMRELMQMLCEELPTVPKLSILRRNSASKLQMLVRRNSK